MENVIENENKMTFLFSQSVADKYKEVSEVINSVAPQGPRVRVKGLRAMMEESFFHGANFHGNNFIA